MSIYFLKPQFDGPDSMQQFLKTRASRASKFVRSSKLTKYCLPLTGKNHLSGPSMWRKDTSASNFHFFQTETHNWFLGELIYWIVMEIDQKRNIFFLLYRWESKSCNYSIFNLTQKKYSRLTQNTFFLLLLMAISVNIIICEIKTYALILSLWFFVSNDNLVI